MNEFVSWQQRTKPLPPKLMLYSLLSLAAVVDDRSRGRNRRVSQRVCLGHVRQVFKKQWQLAGSLHSENLRRDLQNQRVTGLPSPSGEVGVTVWDPLEFLPVCLPFVFVFRCFFQKQQGWSSVNNGGRNQTSDPFVAVATFTDFASERRRPNSKVRSQAVGCSRTVHRRHLNAQRRRQRRTDGSTSVTHGGQESLWEDEGGHNDCLLVLQWKRSSDALPSAANRNSPCLGPFRKIFGIITPVTLEGKSTICPSQR